MPTAASASAVYNFVSQLSVVDPAQLPDLLDSSIKKIYMQAEQVDMVLEDWFETANIPKPDSDASGRFTTKLSEVTDALELPVQSSDTQGMNYSEPMQLWDKTIYMRQYQQGVRVDENMVKFDQSGKIWSMLNGLVNCFRVHKLYQMHNLLNNAFATYTYADGMYLIDSSRPKGDPKATSWSNDETDGTPSMGRIATMRLNFQKQKNERGRPQPNRLTEICAPPDLEQQLWENSMSDKDPETSRNTKNWLRNAYKISISPWFSSTSAWFGRGERKGNGQELLYVTCFPLQIRDSNETNPKIVWGKFGKKIDECDAIIPRNIRGNSG